MFLDGIWILVEHKLISYKRLLVHAKFLSFNEQAVYFLTVLIDDFECFLAYCENSVFVSLQYWYSACRGERV